MRRKRNFWNFVSHPIQQIHSSFIIDTVCKTSSSGNALPVFCVIAGPQNPWSVPSVLVSGGVHGDEPAGVFACISFLQDMIHSYLNHFRFFIFPCVNPSGFELNTRRSECNYNINREFSFGTQCHESLSIIQSLCSGPSRYLFTMDMHETDLSDDGKVDEEGYGPGDFPGEYFLYETCRDPSNRIGHLVVDQIKQKTPVCQWPTIWGDVNSGGVVYYPEGCCNPTYAAGTSFDGFLYAYCTNHSFTVETPRCLPLEKRVELQLLTLKIALDNLA